MSLPNDISAKSMTKKQAGSASVLAPIIDSLCKHAPFDQMEPVHLEFMAKRLKLGFYPKGQIITGPDKGIADRFYIIKQGRVRGETEPGENAEGESAWELMTGECFPIGALLAHRPARTRTRAAEDTFCFELDRDSFKTLLLKSPVFHDFCTRRLANLLDNALRRVQTTAAARMSESGSLDTPLKNLLRRQPVTCGPDTPLREALERMQAEQVGSIIITDDDTKPLGVLTLRDVLSRIILPGRALATPVRDVMTPNPIALAPNARAYEAALLMAQHGFGHVCVASGGKLVGVLSERDLFSLQRVGLANLSRTINGAERVDILSRLEKDIHRLVEQMLAQGASVEQLTQIITTLNDSLTERVIILAQQEIGTPSTPFTWLAFGSEGRFEQTLRTDQDNGILFITPPGKTPDQARQELLPLARRINEALAECGFPLCKGGVMASNPECCLSMEEWQARFGRWIDQGTPEHLLNATIYFDLRPLYGDSAPAEQLRAWLNERVSKNSRFRRQMAANALRNRPPLGLIRDFRVSSGGKHPNTLDLKTQGLAPFVDAARLYALTYRMRETNTVARLSAAAQAGALSRTDVDAWIEAYNYIQLLRMRNHQHQAEEGVELTNRIDPDTLNELDRRILKEAFRQARKLQTKIELEYQL